MCYAPVISLSTAIIELVLASVLLLLFPKTKLRNFFAAFIYLLGFYQFSEFMICSSNYAVFWATIGFVTYSFFPAIALHAVLKIFKKKTNLILIYSIPIVFSLAALNIPGFIIRAECMGFFVYVGNILTQSFSFPQLIPFIIYVIYYGGFLALVSFIIFKDYLKQKNGIKKEMELVEIISIFLMILPTLILIILLPSFGFMVPSVLCEFAIFVAIGAFICVYLETKLKKKKTKSKKLGKTK